MIIGKATIETKKRAVSFETNERNGFSEAEIAYSALAALWTAKHRAAVVTGRENIENALIATSSDVLLASIGNVSKDSSVGEGAACEPIALHEEELILVRGALDAYSRGASNDISPRNYITRMVENAMARTMIAQINNVLGAEEILQVDRPVGFR